jgi:hypothetical protein
MAGVLKEVAMDDGRIDATERAHDQPAEGGREQAEGTRAPGTSGAGGGSG